MHDQGRRGNPGKVMPQVAARLDRGHLALPGRVVVVDVVGLRDGRPQPLLVQVSQRPDLSR